MEKSRRTGRRMGCLIGFLSGIAIVIILIFAFLFGFPRSSRNVAKYQKLLTEYKDLRTGFVAFPAEIPSSGLENDPEFYFFYQDTMFDPTAEVYLRCTYDETDFNAELDRLENYRQTVSSTFQNTVGEEAYEPKPFKRDEDGLFSYPAYIAILADDHAYEYALITGEREITYVYFAFKRPGIFREVPDDCLPDPFVGHLDWEEGQYNIYYFRAKDKNHLGVLSYERSGEE